MIGLKDLEKYECQCFFDTGRVLYASWWLIATWNNRLQEEHGGKLENGVLLSSGHGKKNSPDLKMRNRLGIEGRMLGGALSVSPPDL